MIGKPFAAHAIIIMKTIVLTGLGILLMLLPMWTI